MINKELLEQSNNLSYNEVIIEKVICSITLP